MTAHVEDADPWFVDLEDVAQRVERNERNHRRTTRRLRVMALFLLLAFLFLAYRSESSDNRITANTGRIQQTQATSCAQGAEYIAKFNALQDTLAAIDRMDTLTNNPAQRDAIIKARETARILPVPSCP